MTDKLLNKDIDKRVVSQFEYIEKIREINKGKVKKVYAKTFGCAQNEADMANMLGMCRAAGYEICSEKEQADIILYNTCAVREHAELRVMGNIGALKGLKKLKPDLIIIIAGCMIQQEHIQKEIKQKYRHVDILLGPQNEYKLPQCMYDILEKHSRLFEVSLDNEEFVEDMPNYSDNKYKAMIPIMSGCNNFCSYCIVPYVRGRERSRHHEKIIAQVKTCLENGIREITLLGQNVNSYGKDLKDGYDFADLLYDLNALEGEFIINFMTSHPKDASHKLIDTIAKCEKVSRCLHLPFQAGNDDILKAMNRKYTSGEYLELIEYARSKISDLTLTSDVIVGFPGETNEQFEDTLKLIEKVKFDGLFTFIYSRRNGTPAAEMKNQIDESEKKRRFNILLEKQNEITKHNNDKYDGQTLRVFCEGVSKNQEDALECRTSGGKIVHISRDDGNIGKFLNVKIEKVGTFCMYGSVVD